MPQAVTGYTPTYEPKKLKELILYVADRCKDDPHFGAVKLNKILYYADFYAYRILGDPISGAEYQKLPEGPAPREILPARESLIHEGLIDLEQRPVFNHVQQRVVPRQRYRQTLLSDEQLALVDQVITNLWHKSGREASDMSHAEPGWKLVQYYETIPYTTAWFSSEPLTQDQLDRARRVAEKHELLGR